MEWQSLFNPFVQVFLLFYSFRTALKSSKNEPRVGSSDTNFWNPGLVKVMEEKIDLLRMAVPLNTMVSLDSIGLLVGKRKGALCGLSSCVSALVLRASLIAVVD